MWVYTDMKSRLDMPVFSTSLPKYLLIYTGVYVNTDSHRYRQRETAKNIAPVLRIYAT